MRPLFGLRIKLSQFLFSIHWLQGFHDFLNDLQDWEQSMKEKDKHMGISEDEKFVSLYFIIFVIL